MNALTSLFPLLFLLACPLMMVWMMRGGHGGGHAQTNQAQTNQAQVNQAQANRNAGVARIAELEREVARLRAEEAHTSPWVETGRR